MTNRLSQTNNINAIDLFSGAGGLSLGFRMAGVNILVGIDNNEAALMTFKNNHRGSVTICGNIENIQAHDIEEKVNSKTVDLILGGPPCQGLSLSGPRKFHDSRNRLFLSYAHITDQIGPKAFVLENVPGLLSLFKGKIKDAIIDEFTHIGYEVKFKTLTAADYGVPQLRKRVFFVGVREDVKQPFAFPKSTHFNRATLFKDQSYVTCEEALSDLSPLMDNLGSEKQKYFTPPQNDYQRAMRNGAHSVYNHIAVNHNDKVKKIISMVPEGGNYKDLPKEYRNTRNFHVAWTRYHSKKPAPTIDTGHRHHFHYKYNRTPTVRECARLQSFPDNFIFYGNKSQQYAQVGNAVPPLLGKALALEVVKCL